jgi:glycosyltransferase involved in cell wall biosynthesis
VSLFLPQEKAYHAGGRYVFEALRELSRRHEIALATRLEQGELPALEALRPFCRKIHPYPYRSSQRRGLFAKAGLVLNYLGFSRYADRLIRERDFDLVMVEWVETALLIGRSKTPMILDAHDVISKPALRLLQQSSGLGRLPALVKYLLTRTAERSVMRRFQTIFTRSQCDKDFLLSLQPGLKVKTVPHPAGLDIGADCYQPRPNSILFLASYKYRRLNVDAALWFHDRVLPLVRRRLPDARFVIAGYGPPEELTALAGRDPLVEVTGFVDDLDRCYKEAALFVAPILTGGGIIVKVLDAMAAERPVVATSYGNEGICARHGHDLLIADDPAGFAEAVIKLLTEPEFARQLAENGKEFVRRNYSLESVIESIEGSFAELQEDGNSSIKGGPKSI